MDIWAKKRGSDARKSLLKIQMPGMKLLLLGLPTQNFQTQVQLCFIRNLKNLGYHQRQINYQVVLIGKYRKFNLKYRVIHIGIIAKIYRMPIKAVFYSPTKSKVHQHYFYVPGILQIPREFSQTYRVSLNIYMPLKLRVLPSIL